MLYRVVKLFVRLALRLFCRKITINDTDLLQSKGPLLLACNHPNSFLDAIILGSLFQRPVHFLARGDAFRTPLVNKLLTTLKLIPIYRLSEGREYLALNDATFEQCSRILLHGGIVLIFSEGLCINQWALQPLKKGTARIALNAWAQPAIKHFFHVLPVSINYNGFRQIGKRVIIHFGTAITWEELPIVTTEGEAIQNINNVLAERLKKGMLQSNEDSEIVQLLISNHPAAAKTSKNLMSVLQQKLQYARSHQILPIGRRLKSPGLIAIDSTMLLVNALGMLILLIPACTGWLLHSGLYLPLKSFVKKKTTGTVFYDSVMFGSLLLLYPFYWLIINGISLFFIHNWYIKIFLLLLPVMAGLYLLWKDCLQRVLNYLSLDSGQRRYIKQLFS
jgi:1-acyl-sn-glycerol-3-phosphate acyltransferase